MPHDLNKLELSHHSGSRGFVAIFLLTLVGSWLVLLAINVLGNATNLFPSPLNPAQTERAWKSRRIGRLAARGEGPEVVILGSSRVMQIRPSYVSALAGGRRTFNYGVSAGNPVDWHAQLGYLLSRGAPPKMLIVGVDEFCFGSGNSVWQLQALGNAALARHLPLRDLLSDLGQALQNVAPQKTWESIKAIRRPTRDNPEKFENRREHLLGDGYLIYKPTSERAPTTRESALTFLKKVTNASDEEMALTPRRQRMFEELLDECRTNGTDVRVILLPLHPVYSSIVMRSRDGRLGHIWDEVAVYLAATCPAHGAKFYDFRDVTVFGGDVNDFWDGQHMNAENDRRMMNAVFGVPPEQKVTAFPSDEELLKAMPKPAAKKRRR